MTSVQHKSRDEMEIWSMRKMIIALLLSVFVLVCIVPVFAVDVPAFVVDRVTAHPGDRVDVTISVRNNPGIASIKLEVTYDDALTLDSVTYNESIGGMFMQPPQKASPVTLNWFNGAADSTGDWVFATLSFIVSADAKLATYPIGITYQAENVYNIAEENLEFEIVNGSVILQCAHASKTETKAVAPSCESDGNALYYTCNACGQVFKADGVTETTVEAEVIPSIGHDWAAATCTHPVTCRNCGTTQGSPLGHSYENGKCTVCGAQEGLIGDVNMDGEVDVMDANLAIAYYYGNVDLSDNLIMMADVNGDGEVDAMDANLIIAYYYGNIEKFPAGG